MTILIAATTTTTVLGVIRSARVDFRRGIRNPPRRIWMVVDASDRGGGQFPLKRVFLGLIASSRAHICRKGRAAGRPNDVRHQRVLLL
jgi:hypothetical protein